MAFIIINKWSYLNFDFWKGENDSLQVKNIDTLALAFTFLIF